MGSFKKCCKRRLACQTYKNLKEFKEKKRNQTRTVECKVWMNALLCIKTFTVTEIIDNSIIGSLIATSGFSIKPFNG